MSETRKNGVGAPGLFDTGDRSAPAEPPRDRYDELDVPAAETPKLPADAYDELDVPEDPYDEVPAAPAKKPTSKPRTASGAAKKAAPRGTAASGAGKKSAGKKPGKKKKKKKTNWSGLGLTLGLCLALVFCAGLIGAQLSRYSRFRQMRAAVERQTFYAGTVVDGEDVSGMTMQQAQRHWSEDVEPSYSGRTVFFDNGNSVTALDLGYQSNYLSVLANAWGADRYGTLEERYRSVTQRETEGSRYEITRRLYSEEALTRYVEAAAKALDRAPVEPRIASMDPETFAFSFEEGKAGQAVNQAILAQAIRGALEQGGGTVAVPIEPVQPETTVDEIQANYGLIAYATTNASSSSSDRLNNVRLALSTINGTRVAPGATFSFNDTVGQRTTERGYRAAGAYAAGEVVEEVGGGICQVSTTLFNAVVKADLEIKERHNHSMPVGYVDKGKDATVDWGHQDFRFVNNTDSEVYIGAYLSSDKRVRVGIFGKLLENGKYITVEAKTTGTLNFQTVYETSLTLSPGQQRLKQEGRTGYTAEAYKIVWDKDGNQLEKTLLCKSTYPARNKIIEVGP